MLFLLSALAVILSLIFTKITQLNKKLKSQNELISDLKVGTDELLNNKNYYQKLSTIDEQLFLNDDLTYTLNNYEKFKTQIDDDEKKNEIQNRITIIKRILANKENDIDSQSNTLKKLLLKEQQLSLLEKEIKKLNLDTKMLKDSFTTQINELNDDLIEKENKIKNLESIKVITFNSIKGNKIHYLGEVVDEKANGGGIGIWSTGSIYKGQWRNNLQHGTGTYEWVDGQKYDGNYVNGKRQGKGKYIWPSGERYDGEWNNDKRNGLGKLYDIDGNIQFEGKWIDDKPVRE